MSFMRQEFYKHDPLALAIGLAPNPTIEATVHKNLAQGLSLLARDKENGKLLGACINYLVHPWDADDMDRLACHVKCEKQKQVLHFQAFVQRSPQVFRKYNINKIYELGYLFVKNSETRKKIGLRLVSESRELAAELGFPLIRIGCTGDYSSKLCEKMGMKLIAEFPYSSYVDKDLKPIFMPPHPHTTLKVYVHENPKISVPQKTNNKINKTV